MNQKPSIPPRVPPRWFVHIAWRVHRLVYRASGGRLGLWKPKPGKSWGTMRLTTTGRKSGNPHSVVLAYLDDGPNIVAMSMNGWGNGHPAWWLNLQANPRATLELDGEVPYQVLARAAEGAEHDRLWAMWQGVNKDLDAYAAQRRTETPLIVLSRPDLTPIE